MSRKTNGKGKKLGRKIKIFIVLLLAGLIWSLLAPVLAQILIVEKKLDQADAIFILSGSSAYRERVSEAVQNYKNGVSAKIILTNDGVQSGWDADEERNPLFYERARRELIAQGVPAQAIEVLSETVSGTHDEAVLFQRFAREKGITKVLLVTSAYHTRRALWTFERENPSQVEFGISAPPVGEQTPTERFWWLTPKGWSAVGGEYVKFAGYWVFY